MPSLVVCALSRLAETVATTGARHVATLINQHTAVERPPAIAPERHLMLGFSDIVEPLDGHILPQAEHVERFLSFTRAWADDPVHPLVVHCWAGISRSTAGAFIAACALQPRRDVFEIATLLRAAAPQATPNARLVALADAHLHAQGRMSAAIAAIGRGADAFEGVPFALPIDWDGR
jgi:predicted protein tyrosine phosphatase